jgi:hypothetical protein
MAASSTSAVGVTRGQRALTQPLIGGVRAPASAATTTRMANVAPDCAAITSAGRAPAWPTATITSSGRAPTRSTRIPNSGDAAALLSVKAPTTRPAVANDPVCKRTSSRSASEDIPSGRRPASELASSRTVPGTERNARKPDIWTWPPALPPCGRTGRGVSGLSSP